MKPPTIIHELPEFWFVWCKKGKIPQRTHTSQSAAEAEAIRLALLKPGSKFIVLKSVGKFHVKTTEKQSESQQTTEMSTS